MSAICFLPEWYCATYRACLCFSPFLFLSFYCDNIFSVGLLYWACMCISCSLHLLFFLLYFVYDYIILYNNNLTVIHRPKWRQFNSDDATCGSAVPGSSYIATRSHLPTVVDILRSNGSMLAGISHRSTWPRRSHRTSLSSKAGVTRRTRNAYNDSTTAATTVNCRDAQRLLQASFWGCGNFAPPPSLKKLTNSCLQTAIKLCVLDSFFRPRQWITNISL